MLKSLGGVSSVLTNIILATSPHSAGAAKDTKKSSNKEDAIVMDTKLKIIDILKVGVTRQPVGSCKSRHSFLIQAFTKVLDILLY